MENQYIAGAPGLPGQRRESGISTRAESARFLRCHTDSR